MRTVALTGLIFVLAYPAAAAPLQAPAPVQVTTTRTRR